MNLILKCECGEELKVECFDGEEVEGRCLVCDATIRATANADLEAFVIDEIF